MPEFRVTWEIDIDAESPHQAAQYARDAQLRRGTEAVVFDVQDPATGEITRVDLLDDEGDYVEDHGGPPHRHDSDGNPSF